MWAIRATRSSLTSVHRRAPLGSLVLQRPSGAQVMTVRIGNMKEALAPLRVARRRLDLAAGGDQSGIQPVHIRVVEDHAPHHDHCRAAGWTIRFTTLLPALKLVKPSASPPYSIANTST